MEVNGYFTLPLSGEHSFETLEVKGRVVLLLLDLYYFPLLSAGTRILTLCIGVANLTVGSGVLSESKPRASRHALRAYVPALLTRLDLLFRISAECRTTLVAGC